MYILIVTNQKFYPDSLKIVGVYSSYVHLLEKVREMFYESKSEHRIKIDNPDQNLGLAYYAVYNNEETDFIYRPDEITYQDCFG